jgi:uncharacterized protein YbjT (DUF2867 family)
MEFRRVCVIGGSGFVGCHVARLLSAERYLVSVPTRNRERAKSLILLPTVDVINADVHDPATLATQLRGMDAVINLVGVLQDGHGKRSFEAAHVGLTRKIITACGTAGVRRYLHMSALGADANGPSRYQRTKGAAEALVRDSNLDWTIFRPSVIFGREDRFLNMFAHLQRLLPVILLGRPHARFQPAFVEDVAAAIVTALDNRDAYGHSYDLCGPRVYTLRELVEVVGRLTGHCRPVIGLPDGLAYLQATVQLLTRDNYHSMQVDNVCDQSFPFGIRPKALEAEAPQWLAAASPRARYRDYRGQARRIS